MPFTAKFPVSNQIFLMNLYPCNNEFMLIRQREAIRQVWNKPLLFLGNQHVYVARDVSRYLERTSE